MPATSWKERPPRGRSTRSFASTHRGGRAAIEAISDQSASASWALAHDLIARARIGCVPGADFGDNGEGYIRFCFARDRRELAGALESLGKYLVERSSSLT